MRLAWALFEAGAGHEDAGLDQLLDEVVHRRERLGRGGAPFSLSSVVFRTP